MNKFKDFLAPPVYTDEEPARRARILHMLLIYMSITFIGLGGLGTVFIFTQKLIPALTILVGAVTIAIAYTLNQHGKVKAASIFLLSIYYACVTGIIVVSQGMRSLNIMFYVSGTIMAGLLLGSGGAVVFAGVTILSGLFMVIVSNLGLVSFPGLLPLPAISGWTLLLINLSLTVVTLSIAINELTTALKLARADLTERIKAETARQQNEARLQTIMLGSPDIILEINRAGRVIFANRYVDQFMGKHVHELVLPEYAEKISAAVEHCFQTGLHNALEVQTHTFTGDITWDAVRLAPVREGEQVTSVVLISTDITERKQAEINLQLSEDMYRRAIISAGAVPYYLDHRTRTYTFMGEGIHAMTGYTPQEMNPDLWVSLEQEGFPRGNLAHLTYEEADQLTDEDNTIAWECDYRILTRDGRTRWVADTSVKGLNDKGEWVGVIGILQDITERKQAEQAIKRYADRLEMLRQVDHAVLASHSPEETALAAAWRIRKIVACERAGVTLFNLETRQSTLLAASHLEETILGPLGPYSFEAYGAEIIPHLEEGQPYIIEDVLKKEKLTLLDQQYAEQGIRAWLIMPLIDQGQLIGALNLGRCDPGPFSSEESSVAKDVANQLAIAISHAKLVEALQASNTTLEHRVIERTAQLETANRDLEAFSYSVSHDLRAPLRAVNSFSAILVKDFSAQLDNEAKQLLGRVQENALKMNRLVEGLLAFSRTERQSIRPVPVDLKHMAQDVFTELKEAQAQVRQIEFTVGALPTASVDPTLFKQVFTNLISNALKYTGKRESAQIKIDALEKNNETIIFIRDNGTGFDMKYADKLFGVFQRLHSEAEFEGTGIGLSIVARIIQKHGGRIWVEAEPDKGATFYFTVGKSE